MSARSPRRSFANPFVVTLAAMPACVVSPSPQPQQPVVQQPSEGTPSPTPHPESPPPGPGPGTVVRNPPRPVTPDPAPAPAPPKQQPVAYEQRWVVTRQGATCRAMPRVDCPKPGPDKAMPTCNPPPPMKYACPDGMLESDTLTVVMYAGATECVIQPPPMKCPPTASCNPPRPQAVACPGGPGPDR